MDEKQKTQVKQKQYINFGMKVYVNRRVNNLLFLFGNRFGEHPEFETLNWGNELENKL